MKVLALCSSPRRDGNSHALAAAALLGAAAAGHEIQSIHVPDYVQGMLQDCRTCRRPEGNCNIEDRYDELVLEHVLDADALVYATPLYWYGMSGILKTFFDRLFCLTSNSSPVGATVAGGITGKRVAAVISCEESYRGATLGIETQFQELTRYLHQDLVGVVVGLGNSRGEVSSDPADPLAAAKDLGQRLFDVQVTDYRIDTPRSNKVWG